MSDLFTLITQGSQTALLLGIFLRLGNITATLKYHDLRLRLLEGAHA